MPAAAATKVFMKAAAAMPSAASAEPALKPNHPKNRMPVPSMVIVRLCGRHRRVRPALAPAQQEDERQCRGTGVHVDHGATGEVEGAEVGQPATGEDPVGHRAVDQDGPERDEHGPRRELHAVGHGPADQGRRDHREGQLEGAEDDHGDREGAEELVRAQIAGQHRVQVLGPEELEVAEPAGVTGAAEGQREARRRPRAPG